MLKGAKLRSQLFDILGVRVIVTNRESIDASRRPAKPFEADREEGDAVEVNFQLDESRRNSKQAEWNEYVNKEGIEKAAVKRTYELIAALPRWSEDSSRYKDYVSNPKPSG